MMAPGRMPGPVARSFFDRRTGFQPVRVDSDSRLSANETTGWKPVGQDRQDACPPATRIATGIPLALLLLLSLLVPLQAAEAADPALKLREQLRGVMLQLRTSQGESANAQAAQAAARDTAKRNAPPADKARTAESKAAELRAASRAAKLSFNEKRELESLPERIAALEDEQTALHARMADPALYQSAPQEVAQIKARMDALEGEIEAAMLRWEELESRAAG